MTFECNICFDSHPLHLKKNSACGCSGKVCVSCDITDSTNRLLLVLKNGHEISIPSSKRDNRLVVEIPKDLLFDLIEENCGDQLIELSERGLGIEQHSTEFMRIFKNFYDGVKVGKYCAFCHQFIITSEGGLCLQENE